MTPAPATRRPAPAPLLARAVAGWRGPALTAVAAGAWCLAAALGDPTRAGNRFPPCPFKALTGWDCPGCGSTRMLHELAHAHLGAAAHDNALALLALPFLLYSYTAWALARCTPVRLPRHQPGPAVVLAVAGLVLAWGVARNLPLGPLRALHV